MADLSPLAGPLDRASHVISLAWQLARAFTDEYDRQGTGYRRVDPAAWSRQQPAFNEFCNALLELRDEMQNPPDGFAPVAEVLMEAARVAKQIRDTMQTTDGRMWQTFLDFRFHFNSVVAKGNEAIRTVTKAQRLDDPFAFLEPTAEDQSEPISVSDLLDYAIKVRDSLDDDGDLHRDDALNLIQVAKAFVYAHELGLVRKSECPETLLNRDGAKRKLDYLIPLLRARTEPERTTPAEPSRSSSGDLGSSRNRGSEGASHDVSLDSANKPTDSLTRNQKRSTERGEGRAKLIAALTKHHQYADGSCLNLEPVNNNDLAKSAGVEKSTASDFFKKEFGGHGKYKTQCRRNAAGLALVLKNLNGELHGCELLYGRRPADEDDRDEE